MGRKEDNIKKAETLLHKKEFIRNIGTAAHIDHGKTTLSDSLIAGAGMISEELAGSQLFMDYDEQEQARGITINAAIASMVNELKITPEQMEQRFVKIITEVNTRILKQLPDDLKDKWALKVASGNVAFGSAFHKWALSVPYMKKTGLTFKDVYRHCQEGTMK